MSQLDSLSKGMLSISAQAEGEGLVVQWVGRSDERDPAEFLNPYLGKLATQVGKQQPVTVDFRRLEYMNSSTIKPIIRFIQALAAASPKVTVTYNAAQKWQSISFDALRTVFLPLKNVHVTG